MTSEASRVEIMACDFEARGLDAGTARSLSSELALRYPVSARLGLTDLAGRLAASGMDDDAALDAALSICTVEMMDRGADFDTVVKTLRRACKDPGTAFAGAVHGSHLYRNIARSTDVEDELSHVTVIALAVMAVATLAFTLWMHFSI